MPRTTAETAGGRADPISPAAALIAGKKVAPDATNLLIQDHREVQQLFEACGGLDDPKEKMKLAKRICLDLKAHMRIEEELFYPAAREATGDDDLVKHSIEEHKKAKQLISEIEAEKKPGANFDRLMDELEQAIEDHVEEEETELFPELRRTSLDLYDLGRQLGARRVEGFAELTGKPVPKVAEEASM